MKQSQVVTTILIISILIITGLCAFMYSVWPEQLNLIIVQYIMCLLIIGVGAWGSYQMVDE